eukprot:1026318-Alexandrium_andersonii.AAC.1
MRDEHMLRARQRPGYPDPGASPGGSDPGRHWMALSIHPRVGPSPSSPPPALCARLARGPDPGR